MSAFEDFVQIELGRRPYLTADVAQETVIVRRGAGPRQLGAVTLAEGQVLGMVGGVLVGVTGGGGGGSALISYTEEFTTPQTTWAIAHNINRSAVIAQAYDAAGFQLIPNEILVVDADNVTLTFNTPQTGSANLILLP